MNLALLKMRIISRKFRKILRIFRKKDNFIRKDIHNPKLKFWGVTQKGLNLHDHL